MCGLTAVGEEGGLDRAGAATGQRTHVNDQGHGQRHGDGLGRLGGGGQRGKMWGQL